MQLYQLETVYEPLAQWLPQVRERLLAIVPPGSQWLTDSLAHALTGGGKFLRPSVSLLAGELNPTGSLPQRVEIAAVAEMIHIATLLHDDVLDDADLRRGRPTVRQQWGNTVAILSGDYLLAQASLKLSQVGNIRVVGIFSHVLADLCDGEVTQLQGRFQSGFEWEQYAHKTRCKTASLFAAGCEAAGVLGGWPEDQVQAARQYGLHFGVAFQLVDDLLDFTATEAELGKPVLDDLRNGLLTAPVLLGMQADPQRFEPLIARIFDGDDSVLSDIQAALTDTHALQKTRQLIADTAQQAQDALAPFSNSPAKQALLSLAQTATTRTR
jgi:all-trans-nonaprenyl-diphosphate synthase